jgi:hypothetical protein
LRYHLLVAYILDSKGIGAGEMFTQEFDQRQLEAEITSLARPLAVDAPKSDDEF